jgi:hypothetical protein
MTTLTTPPAASTELNSEGLIGGAAARADLSLDTADAASAADTADAAAAAVARAADRAAAWSRYHPSAGSGVRNGLVRTRTVRSNSRRALRRMKDDRGAATAEYIVATMAAVGFAGLLIVILRA